VLLGIAAAASAAAPAHSQHANVPKQVHLVLDGNRILASNVGSTV
jgi:hypothetical protein